MALVKLFYVVILTSHLFTVIWIWVGKYEEKH